MDLEEIITSKSAKVEVNLEDLSIKCYPELIGLIFYNLINNGLKFNESKVPEVVCTYDENKTHWLFSVQDNGIGIDSEYTEKIFQPFNRLQGSNYEGSGIGLSICKRVVNIHKGKIWVEQNDLEGACFKFSISKKL